MESLLEKIKLNTEVIRSLTDENAKLLEQLKEHNNTDCFISLITNGSIWLDDKKLEFLKNFTDLNICISIDGINSRFEYMRWPGKWNRLLENIEQYQKICQGNISISYTTMLMILLCTTIIFLGAFPSKNFFTSSESIAAFSISFTPNVNGNSILKRVFPLKETG